MSQELTLFVGMFTTLLAIINPLEALPVFLKLLEGKDEAEHCRVARLSCFYALLLAFFFLFFGHLILWVFGVPLSMVRIVGGIILMRIGFTLFSPSSSGASLGSVASGSGDGSGAWAPAWVDRKKAKASAMLARRMLINPLDNRYASIRVFANQGFDEVSACPLQPFGVGGFGSVTS